jgi:hypothetical protein
VKRQIGIDFAQHGLEAVAKLPVPRKESWSAVHMRSLMDLILLKPIGNAACGKIRTGTRKKLVVQRDERITKPIAFLL